jgi:hypothetical protein
MIMEVVANNRKTPQEEALRMAESAEKVARHIWDSAGSDRDGQLGLKLRDRWCNAMLATEAAYRAWFCYQEFAKKSQEMEKSNANSESG